MDKEVALAVIEHREPLLPEESSVRDEIGAPRPARVIQPYPPKLQVEELAVFPELETTPFAFGARRDRYRPEWVPMAEDSPY